MSGLNLGNIISTSFTYDNLGRLITRTESINGKIFDFNYEYNKTTGKIYSYEYPSGLKLLYSYDQFGYLNQIRNEANYETLWEAMNANPRGQLTQLLYGGNMTVNNQFDTHGFLTRISTNRVYHGIEQTIQDLTFNFDPTTGNLLKRTDEIQNLTETFGYDIALKSRLTSWQVGAEEYTINYADNGNINSKSDVTNSGQFNYSNNKIHQVVEVTNPTPEYVQMTKAQEITYTAFNKTKSIKQQIGLVDVELKFTYGTNNNRIKTVLSTQGTPLETRYYLGDYETKQTGKGAEQQLHYLYGSDGLFAILEQGTTSREQLYYILKDHQGSYNQITDVSGNTIELLSFDPWGRRRNPLTWSYTNAPAYSKFSRGYTGHEHLDNFGLINMNGRMYDPALGRFLSPDPLLQNPSSTQGHNRYSYVLNNPLIYTDPTGYDGLKDKPAGWDAQWEVYCNFDYGRRGGSLSDSYWANSYRGAESNWSVMSKNTFENTYGNGSYSQCRNYMTGANVPLNPGSYTAIADVVNSLRSQKPLFFYLFPALNKYALVSSNSPMNNYSYSSDGGLVAGYDSEGYKPATQSLLIAEIEGLFAGGGGGGQISMDASHNRIGFVPLDIGENYGAYQMANYRCNISVRGNQEQITVRATSSNTSVSDGEVVFSSRASLIVNGNVIQNQILANGMAIFKLPSSQNISLTINGGWTMRYDYGGAAVPVFHPIFWPFSLNFTDNFKLK